MEQAVLAALRRANRLAALICGVALAGCAGFILVEIVLRQTGGGLGGTDEISGYVMAATTAWGFGYALLERAHVRIDLLRGAMPSPARVLFDLAAVLALAFVAAVLAVQSWPVLARSLEHGSRANTPLETPLVIPQALWWSGLVWFAVMAAALVMVACLALLRGRRASAQAAIGVAAESEQTP